MTDAELLATLLIAASRSDCSKIRFGAAVLYADQVIVSGWNHNPLPGDGYSCASHSRPPSPVYRPVHAGESACIPK